jgi:hypothetical protein
VPWGWHCTGAGACILCSHHNTSGEYRSISNCERMMRKRGVLQEEEVIDNVEVPFFEEEQAKFAAIEFDPMALAEEVAWDVY